MVTTRGFADLLEIGNQSRERLLLSVAHSTVILIRWADPELSRRTQDLRTRSNLPRSLPPKLILTHYPSQELNIKRPSVLYSSVVEVDERVTLMGYTSDPRRAERAVIFDKNGGVEKHYDDEELPEGEVVKGLSGEAVRIMKRVDEEAVRRDLQKLYDEGYRSLAIVFIHAFTYSGETRTGVSVSSILVG